MSELPDQIRLARQQWHWQGQERPRFATPPGPGGFYGGWITPELVGPFKGESGSQDW